MSSAEEESKQYFIAVHTKNDTGKTKLTFYIRPATHSQIFGGAHEINMKAHTFESNFELKERNLDKQSMTNLIITCADATPEHDWALWIRKLCRNYQQSRGYWKILDSLQETPRVPLDHLNCILSLLRNETMAFDQSHNFTFTFLKQRDDFNDSVFREEDIECEYELTFWNGVKVGNVSFALRIYKAKYALTGKKRILSTRDSYFMHYRSDIEWMWYDYDAQHYQKYVSGYGVSKQLEASYQGVSEDMFPIQRFGRSHNTKGRMFNCGQLTTISNMVAQEKIACGHRTPFVLKIVYDKDGGKIIEMEQLAIINMYEQFSRHVERISLAMIQRITDIVFGFVRLNFDGIVPNGVTPIILNFFRSADIMKVLFANKKQQNLEQIQFAH